MRSADRPQPLGFASFRTRLREGGVGRRGCSPAGPPWGSGVRTPLLPSPQWDNLEWGERLGAHLEALWIALNSITGPPPMSDSLWAVLAGDQPRPPPASGPRAVVEALEVLRGTARALEGFVEEDPAPWDALHAAVRDTARAVLTVFGDALGRNDPATAAARGTMEDGIVTLSRARMACAAALN